jgi:hypothetical protein
MAFEGPPAFEIGARAMSMEGEQDYSIVLSYRNAIYPRNAGPPAQIRDMTEPGNIE